MDATYHELIAPGSIDSPLKLKIALVFCRYPELRADAQRMHQWLHEIPWALEEALAELADCGLLARSYNEQAEYRLDPHAERTHHLHCLTRQFDDPHQREVIYALIAEADSERRFLKAIQGRQVAVGQFEGYESPAF
jgi:hypothetical protein